MVPSSPRQAISEHEMEPERTIADYTLYSHEAEQAVLGGLLIAPQSSDEVFIQLEDNDFYYQPHRAIYKTMRAIKNEQQSLDVLIVVDYLKREDQLHKIGGEDYLITLASQTPRALNAVYYAQIVRTHAIRRKIIAAAHQIVHLAQHPKDMDDTDLLDQSEKEILNVRRQARTADLFPIYTTQNDPHDRRSMMERSLDYIVETCDRKGVPQMRTGFTSMDQYTAGLQAGELVVIAGRPSMGKTALAMNIVEHQLFHNPDDRPVIVFSLEMSAIDLLLRLYSSIGRINGFKMRNGTMNEKDFANLSKAMDKLGHSQLLIDESANLSPYEINTKVRSTISQYGKDPLLIMVDHIQLMQINHNRNEVNRNMEVSEISRALKKAAKEFNCPILLLSQLNRNVDARPNRRPQMSDLRDSGSIEQDADLVLFIYRNEVYYPNDEKNKGIADIIIGKQRNGPTTTFQLAFVQKYTRFGDLSPNDRTP